LHKTLKNEYFQIAVGILFGTTLLILFFEKKGLYGIFAIVGFFFILLNLIRLIDVLNGKKSNLKKLINWTVIAPIIIGTFIGFVANEFKHLGNIINDSEIFKEFGLYGLIFAIFIVILKYSLKPKENRKFSFTGLLASLIVFPLLFISCVTFINRYKAEKELIPLESIVWEKESEIDEKDKSDSQFWISTNLGIYKEKFKVESELWNNLQKNDTILLFMEKGNLGYGIVERIEKKPTANKVYN
jgi:MFS family permease